MGYRYAQEFIKKWEHRLVWTLCLGVAAAFAMAGGGLLTIETMEPEELDSAASWVLAGAAVLGLAIGVTSTSKQTCARNAPGAS